MSIIIRTNYNHYFVVAIYHDTNGDNVIHFHFTSSCLTFSTYLLVTKQDHK